MPTPASSTPAANPHASSALPAPAPRPGALRTMLRTPLGVIGLAYLALVFLACVVTLPYTLGQAPPTGDGAAAPRFDAQDGQARHLPPSWWGVGDDDPQQEGDTAARRLREVSRRRALEALARDHRTTVAALLEQGVEPTPQQIAAAEPFYLMGTDVLGRDLAVRILAGGGISLTIGLCAAAISVFLGTMYGALAGYLGGRIDAVMMRIVDILYGLPYVLLVVLLAVASDALIDEYVGRTRARAVWIQQTADTLAKAHFGSDSITDQQRKDYLGLPPTGDGLRNVVARVLREDWERRRTLAQREPAGAAPMPEVPPDPPAARDIAAYLAQRTTTGEVLTDLGSLAVRPRSMRSSTRTALDLLTLLVAIGGVSWLTMARVVRGQVLSLRAQPFMEAARALGVPPWRQFTRHLLPNLVGPIIVYATLTVPQAILQESFLSFLGIGVRPPLPSWGTLAAAGLEQLNPYKSNWWLLLFPCLMLATTLLALNFLGEALREAFDPKRGRR